MHFLPACPKNLPVLDKVERVEQGEFGEENPMKCQDEEECWLKYRYQVDRSSQAAKRETDECDDVPENEKTICNLFLGVGKRELNVIVPSLKEPLAGRSGLGNSLTRDLDPPCDNYPYCFYSPPGKKKFIVKKVARETGHEEKVNAVPSSDTNDQNCNVNDLLCSGNGLGRKRSVSRLIGVKLLRNKMCLLHADIFYVRDIKLCCFCNTDAIYLFIYFFLYSVVRILIELT